jgi:hypothetical protein
MRNRLPLRYPRCFQGIARAERRFAAAGGDLSRKGRVDEVLATAEWLNSVPHRHKLVIAGNHDFCLEQQDPVVLLRALTYLQDETCEIEGKAVGRCSPPSYLSSLGL